MCIIQIFFYPDHLYNKTKWKKIQRANKADTVSVVDKMQHETKSIIKSASNEKKEGQNKENWSRDV